MISYEAAVEVRGAILDLNESVGTGLSEVRDTLAQMGATAQQAPVPQSSVELSQTAKGATQVAVKCYAANAEDAANQAQQIYDRLVATYAPSEQP